MAVLLLLGVCLGYAAWSGGASRQEPWLHCLLGLSGVALLVFWRRNGGPRKVTWGAKAVFALTALLPVYVLLQALPLPGSLVDLLSPMRGAQAELLAGAGFDRYWYSISVHPAATLEHLLRFVGYALMMLIVRELALRRPDHGWRIIAPLVAVACLQAAGGLLQVQYGEPMALGSYLNRNHFAGLLEIALPFAPALSLAVFRESFHDDSLEMRPALMTSAGLIIAVLLLGAVLLSLSRSGFVIALLGILQVAFLYFVPAWPPRAVGIRAALVAGALAAVFLVGVLFLPSDALVGRFADLASTEEISADGRVAMWRETQGLIGDYWLAGCGLGGFRSAFVTYRLSTPMKQISYAHNDFLQYFAELGLLGFALGFIPVVIIWWRLLRRFRLDPRPNRRFLALGCLVSIQSLALHSLVDFNLYIPANALAFAWVLGLSAALAQRNWDGHAPTARLSAEEFRPSAGNFSKGTRRTG